LLTPRKRELPYTKGDLNKAIDLILHPLFEEYPWLIGVDGLLHGMVEGNSAESLEKFLKYNAPKLLRVWVRWMRENSTSC
jgi:hypothetical protein